MNPFSKTSESIALSCDYTRHHRHRHRRLLNCIDRSALSQPEYSLIHHEFPVPEPVRHPSILIAFPMVKDRNNLKGPKLRSYFSHHSIVFMIHHFCSLF
ncbi:hypothetical protein O181_071380 [Austropuccinia psidii MF-1]|uniref:Uncharacterized protein n=1 Tax=Austropuccinia psidii MF-1 TaxID=1389203 RepID=A0A9Q3F6L5_9BASI|nr:hypothetical protein [Austropuccinia psidii MF-1]